jgi:hypothetical protein
VGVIIIGYLCVGKGKGGELVSFLIPRSACTISHQDVNRAVIVTSRAVLSTSDVGYRERIQGVQDQAGD